MCPECRGPYRRTRARWSGFPTNQAVKREQIRIGQYSIGGEHVLCAILNRRHQGGFIAWFGADFRPEGLGKTVSRSESKIEILVGIMIGPSTHPPNP